MSKLFGMCGLECSDCEAYQATQANDADRIAAVAAQWSQQFGGNITPESVWCDGCTTTGARKCGHCAECDLRACGLARGLSTCAECADFGCEKLTKFLDAVPPARANLESLRARG